MGIGALWFGVEHVRQRVVDIVGDDGFAGARQFHEPRGKVHRVAGHRVVAMGGAAGVRRHDLAAGDADVRGKRPREFPGERGHAA